MTENTIDVKLLKDIDKAHYFASTMDGIALKIILNLIQGRKDIKTLGSRLTLKDLQKPPLNPRLQLRHTDLAKILLETFYENERVKQVDKNDITHTFIPVIQSGGHYSLKLDCQNNENYFKDDVVIWYLGLRYKDYCSTLIRTLIISPTKNVNVEENYELLRNLQFFIFDCLQDGAKLGEIYEKAVAFVCRKEPNMTTYLTDNFGTLVGMETEVSDYAIKENSIGIAKENMVFHVSVGFSGLVDSDLMDKPPHMYALWIGDCVMVHKDKKASFLKYVPSEIEDVFLQYPRAMGTSHIQISNVKH